MFVRKGTTWKRVRKAFIKTATGWKQVFSDNLISIYAIGLASNLSGEFRGVWINGQHIVFGGRSYNIVQFDNWGNIISFHSFDVYNDFYGAGMSNIVGMADVLAAMPAGRIFTVYSFDEPNSGHTWSPLLQEMYNCGASPGIYGQEMPYRSAYILIAKKGYFTYYEEVVGETYTDPNTGMAGDPYAHVNVRIKIFDGNIDPA
jgi:hypothetical protein